MTVFSLSCGGSDSSHLVSLEGPSPWCRERQCDKMKAKLKLGGWLHSYSTLTMNRLLKRRLEELGFELYYICMISQNYMEFHFPCSVNELADMGRAAFL